MSLLRNEILFSECVCGGGGVGWRGSDFDLCDAKDQTYQRIASFAIAQVPSSSQVFNVFNETSTRLLPYPYLSLSVMPYRRYVIPDDAQLAAQYVRWATELSSWRTTARF